MCRAVRKAFVFVFKRGFYPLEDKNLFLSQNIFIFGCHFFKYTCMDLVQMNEGLCVFIRHVAQKQVVLCKYKDKVVNKKVIAGRQNNFKPIMNYGNPQAPPEGRKAEGNC